MVIPQDESTFRTSDTALASYLVEQGLGTPEIEFGNGSGRAFFVFKRDNVKIDKAVDAWDSVSAKGNVVVFFQAYQTLLRRIRERY
jgi:hypothetical protein